MRKVIGIKILTIICNRETKLSSYNKQSNLKFEAGFIRIFRLPNTLMELEVQ